MRPGGTTLPRDAMSLMERKPNLILAVCVGLLTLIALAATFYVARAYLLPIATAFVFAVILSPICSRLDDLLLPRAVSALVAIGLASGFAYFVFSMIAEPAAAWLEDAPQSIRKAEQELEQLREPLDKVQSLSNEVEELAAPSSERGEQAVVVEGPQLTQSLMSSFQTFAIQLLFVCVLVYFFLLTRHEFRDKIVAFQPTLSRRVRTARMFREVERRVSGYIVTFSAINIVMGIAVGLSCWALGLPNPIMLGGLAGLLNFIPYVGPAISVALLGLAGLTALDTLVGMLMPILAYLAINFLESNVFTPLIMGRRMTLNPLVIILTASFWTWIWGPVGGLISLPMLIMLKVVLEHTPQARPLAALIGPPLARRHDRSIRWAFWRRNGVQAGAPDQVDAEFDDEVDIRTADGEPAAFAPQRAGVVT